MKTPFGLGVGNVYTPIYIVHGKIKVPARLNKAHPDYEGYHEPFWISPDELNSQPQYDNVYRFTGATGLN